MSESVWDKADQASAASAAPAASQAGQGVMPQDGSGLGGGALFGGGRSNPSLFNRTHPAATVRGGVIKDIKDVHSRQHQREGGGLKYWPNGKTGKGTEPTTDAVGQDGKPNRPVMDVHVILDTEYRLSKDECDILSRDFAAEQSADDGTRVFVVQDTRGFGEAIADWNKSNTGTAGIGSPADLIGKRLEVKRLSPPMEPQKWAHRLVK